MKTILFAALAITTLFTAGCRTVAVSVRDEPVRTSRVYHSHGRYYHDGDRRDWGHRSDRYYGRGYGRTYRSRTIVY